MNTPVDKAEHVKRMEVFKAGGTLKAMATKANLSPSGFKRWMETQGLQMVRTTHGRPKVDHEETDRRLAVISKGGTIRAMARELLTSPGNLGTWMWQHGIKSAKQEVPKKSMPFANTVKHTYLKDRPQWEKDLVTHFVTRLIATHEKCGPGERLDIRTFMDIYRDLYGRCDNDSQAANG